METVSVILGQIQLTVIIHIGKQVSANEPNTETWSASVPNEDEAHRVQAFLLNILTAGLQQSRYAVFENAIKEYEIVSKEFKISFAIQTNQTNCSS